MIRKITGKVDVITNDYIVIDNNGIGYRVFMPSTHLEYLSANEGIVSVYTYLSVREDAMLLYGFLNNDDLELFEKLITVSGIGPKGAINILSILSGDDLRFAIYSGDAKAISKASGIGKKTAEKCILELKDKVKIEDVINSSDTDTVLTTTVPKDNETIREAIEALISLGYSSNDATKVVRQISYADGMSVEELIKEALRNI